MPEIRLQPVTEEVAEVLDRFFDEYELLLREASAQVLGYNPEDFEVKLFDPPRRVSPDALSLTIYMFASDNPDINGKHKDWRDALVVAWANYVEAQGDMAILSVLPNYNVGIWPQIAPGAKWGTVAEVLWDLEMYPDQQE